MSHCWCTTSKTMKSPCCVFLHKHFKSADQEQSYIICGGSGIAYLGMTIYRHMELEFDWELATHTNTEGRWGYPMARYSHPTPQCQRHTHIHIGQMGPLMWLSDFLTDLNIGYHWPGAILASSDDWSLCVTQDWSQVRWLDTVPNLLPYAFPK